MQVGMRVDAKRILADSIIELAKKKSMEKITVQDIVDNCNAARRTFYNHFTDKYDLANWIFKTSLDNITRTYADIEPLEKVFGRVLAFMKEDKAFYYTLLTDRQNYFFDFFHECACNFHVELIKKRFGKDALTDSLLFIIKYNCHGQINMAKQWIKTGTKEPPELIGKKVVYNMTPDLKKFFKTTD
ncbi:MAG: TetR/AcrR family transcriptional regulator C-terminal domain-containing protein [Actinobacteria bacterium]|nr:TetR/AcrR family transcriptional regulator C-terminal domain-containing protein [Actinomycetota bacterium]